MKCFGQPEPTCSHTPFPPPPKTVLTGTNCSKLYIGIEMGLFQHVLFPPPLSEIASSSKPKRFMEMYQFHQTSTEMQEGFLFPALYPVAHPLLLQPASAWKSLYAPCHIARSLKVLQTPVGFDV